MIDDPLSIILINLLYYIKCYLYDAINKAENALFNINKKHYLQLIIN
jgi:hypothetical protein